MRSIPLWAANDRANGDAKTRPSPPETGTDCRAEAAGAEEGGGGDFAGAGAGGGVLALALGFGGGAAPASVSVKSLNAAISSGFDTIMQTNYRNQGISLQYRTPPTNSAC